jgi:hypothetical protein
LERGLLCPNQLRANDIEVNDCPLRFLPAHLRSDRSHTIITPQLRIPLHLNDVISYFTCRKPTVNEMQDPDRFPQIEMTAEGPWLPDADYRRNNELLICATVAMQYEVAANNIAPVTQSDLLFDFHISVLKFAAVQATRRKGSITPEELAKRWFIGIETARRTIEQTTQRAVRDFTSTQGSRRLKHTHYQLKYRHLQTEVYTDTLFGKVPSLCKNTCGQIYCTDFQWQIFYPLRSKADAHFTLDMLHKEYGVFHTLIANNAPELVAGEFKSKLLQAGCQPRSIEAYSHNQNLAESAIRDLCRMYRKAMRLTNAPHVLWDHCMELMAAIRSHTALNIHSLQGETPHTVLTGDTGDISHICEFSWYDIVWYIDITEKMQNCKLGCYLGPSPDIGQAMSSKILTSKATVIVRTSVLPLSVEDKNSDVVRTQIQEFDKALAVALGDHIIGIPTELDEHEENDRQFVPYADDEKGEEPVMLIMILIIVF